jgi:hypothetical protein
LTANIDADSSHPARAAPQMVSRARNRDCWPSSRWPHAPPVAHPRQLPPPPRPAQAYAHPPDVLPWVLGAIIITAGVVVPLALAVLRLGNSGYGRRD